MKQIRQLLFLMVFAVAAVGGLCPSHAVAWGRGHFYVIGTGPAGPQTATLQALDTINRIANNTQFAKKKLLDGSAGMTGVASATDVTFMKPTSDTVAGVYAISVATAGERATVDSSPSGVR